MTIGMVVLSIIIGLAALAIIVICLVGKAELSTKVVITLVTLVIAVSCIGGIAWWSFNTEAGKRAYKDQQSNISGGIERTVRVYDFEGDLIEQYRGKFDVETNSDYVLFDDEHGKRHMIYYTTGTVIIDEN